MSFTKSLLLGSAAALATVVGAQAADLPSKKAAPATYVKICDAYGAGFFFIPGTDTCVKLGGYVRAQYDYTPGKDVYVLTPNAVTAASVAVTSTAPTSGTYTTLTGPNNAATPVNTNYYAKATAANYTLATIGLAQKAASQTETGFETRGRIEVDARTPTAMGTARTFVRLRAANTSGIRNTTITNNAIYGQSDTASTGIAIEAAMVQWAGFTFGVAPENYALMPPIMYNGTPWAGFPNGMKQLAYTATLGGGWSATLALEDRHEFGYSNGPGFGTYLNRAATAGNLVANVRFDQAWGFAVLHGMIGNNSVSSAFGSNPNATGSTIAANTNSLIGAVPLGFTDAYAASFVPTPGTPSSSTAYGTISPGQSTFSGWAIGTTVNFKLPMIAAGDQIWFSANYGHGMLGAILGGSGLSNFSTAAQHRLLGGIVRVDQNLMLTGGNGTAANPYTVGTVNAWNINTVFTHYWATQWRSNFMAGYVEINPPTSTASVQDKDMGSFSLPQWGKGKAWTVAGSLIYSPTKDFDIGLELQYASIKNQIQNTATAVQSGTGSAGTGTALTIADNVLKSNNISAKLRVERAF